MDGHHLLAWLLIGLVAGALAGRVVEGEGFGCLADLVVGLAGALVGGIILHAAYGTDVASGFLAECIVAFVGACILLGFVRLLGGRRRGVAAFRRRRRLFR